MLKSAKKIDQALDNLMSPEARAWLEWIFGIGAIISLFIHLFGITIAKIGLYENSSLSESSYLTAITTPFTVILLYEIFQLAISFRKPLSEYVLAQLELVSLVFIRDIFKTLAHFDIQGQAYWWDLTREISFSILSALILLTGTIIIRKIFYAEHSSIRGMEFESRMMLFLKKIISICLMLGIAIILVLYLSDVWRYDSPFHVFDDVRLANFFPEIFIIFIIADTMLFLFGFLYHDEYFVLFSHAVYLIAVILVRLTLSVNSALDVVFVTIGLLITIAVTYFRRYACKSGLVK